MTEMLLQTNPRPDMGGTPVLAVLPECLTALANEPRWVAWCWEKVGERWTKPPHMARGGRIGRHALADKPETWCSFGDVQAAHRKDGLGLELLGLPEFGALDLDDVREPDTGALKPWAADMAARSGSYVEVTPSKTGIRILGRVSPSFLSIGTKKPHPDGGSFEVYTNIAGKKGRYITVSGERMPDAPDILAPIDDIAQELLEIAGKWTNSASPNYSPEQRFLGGSGSVTL